MGFNMNWIYDIIAFMVLVSLRPFSGTLQPTLYWKFDDKTSENFVNEANSSTSNRGFLLPGTEIVKDSGWIGAKFKGNRSGILIDNVTDTCFLAPQNCRSGFSISFHVKWPRNSKSMKNGSLISSANFSILHKSNGYLLVSLWNGTNEWQMKYIRNTSIHGWVCYVVTWNNSLLRLYVNGTLKSAMKDDARKPPENGILRNRSMYSLGDRALPGRIAIGNVAKMDIKECGLRMLIDDLKIWDIALTSNDTKEVCQRAIPGYKVVQNAYKYRDQAYTSIQFANRALHGFTFNSVKVTNLSSCIHKCMESKNKCMSFNIGRGNSTDEYICQLNMVSRKHFPQNVVEEFDFWYYEVYWEP